MSNLSNARLLRLKKMSTDQLTNKLREDSFSMDERIEVIDLLRLRGKDISEFEDISQLKEARKRGRPKRSPKKDAKIIKENILSMTGEELETAIIETGNDDKCRAMIKYLDYIKPESMDEIDLSKLEECDLSVLREILVGTSELLPKKKVPRKKIIKDEVETILKEEKMELDREVEYIPSKRVKVKRSSRQDLPRPGSKAEKIYLQLSTTTRSLYRIALDNETYFSVVQGILERYAIVRPKISEAIKRPKVDRRGLEEKGSSEFFENILKD